MKVIPALLQVVILLAVATPLLRAELTDAQKKELFRKSKAAPTPSRDAAHSSGGSVKKRSGTSSSSAKPSKSGTTSSHSSDGGKKGSGSKKKTPPKHSSHHSTTGSSSSKDMTHGSNTASSSQPVKATAPNQQASLPASGETPVPASTPLPLPHGTSPSAPITIGKSGLEADQGLEPLPTSSHAPEGFWGRIFGSHKSYNYLSSSTRSAIDRAPVRKGRWKYIVVHNSGTREGNARVFDIYHKRVRHMQNGLAYHFVIGDGHGSGDGQIEIGSRWTRQINGGHVASDYLNDIALGICLVGDFNRDQPTKAQVGALEELVDYLRNRVGKSQGRQAIVHAHKEINPRPTDCPGDRFPYSWLHAKFH